MNSPALDLATLPASPQQRRAAFVAIASLGAIALAAALFARVVLGTFPGFVTLYGGAVLMGLAITATILFGQYALSRRVSLLVLACGTLFSAIVFVPYILTFPGSGFVPLFGALANTSTYLWIVWHTALPGAFAAYALLSGRDGTRRVGSRRTTVAVATTVVAAYAAIQLVFALGGMLPPLSRDGQYLIGIYLALGSVVVLAGAALVILQRRSSRTVVDVWLMVPAAALLIESLLNALGGSRYSVGWYFSRIDILVATTFLVVALLAETNRLSHVLANNERRLRGIVNGVTDALIAVDARGAVASVNPAAASLFGFVADDLTGTPISRILPDYAGIADAPQATVVETTGRSARGGLFPVEFARGRVATHASGETIIILRDITQRKVAEEAIRAAHDRAIEAAEVKSQFLATMSHEIRTPINAVVGMSELLLQTPLSDEAREYATTVRDSAESLLAIVNDILDFSKIEAGRMQIDSAPFSPVVAVENATDILAAAARKKGLSLSTYVAPDVPLRVAGDADRLRQVLLNLIGNAVKFTAAGSVTVRAVVDGVEGDAVELRFSVSDTGPGIAQDAAEQLFEPFRQADQSTRRRFGGTGLGLSISRRLVELMGGKIGFDSSPGRGSTFWFTVPYARALGGTDSERSDGVRGARILVVDDEADARQVVDQYLLAWGAEASSTGSAAHALELAAAAAERHAPFDVVIADRRASGDAFGFAGRVHAVAGCESVPIVLLAGGEEPVNAQDARAHGFVAVVRKPIRQNALHDTLLAALGDPSAPPDVSANGALPARSAERVLVLVAEDNPVNRRLALQQLKKLGFRADAVTDGREAIDAVAHGHYDLVLMDCQMPEVDGFEATREIRRDESTRGGHVPIIAMTANTLEGDRQACLAAGMDDYLAKPVQLAALRAVVERFANGVSVAG
ncbi:MAG: two-component system, sensor histidine kinase and response regulator [Candidatus Eremiobacteraeota bacterium]|nr:two-component system, sensor histidine kinase and response regulator [Candidatus Eremiobacteraeota bacterium]